MRPSLFTYKIDRRAVSRPLGGTFHVGRDAVVLSAGIRGRRGVCLIIPLETESQWLRRQQRRHDRLVQRMLP